MKQTNVKGFTLVELLVVIAIIGLLSTLAVVSLTSAQADARDARRISDMKQLQTALELYYSDNQQYPNPSSAVTLGDSSAAVLCTHTTDSNKDGFYSDTTNCTGDPFMGQVPSDPSDGSSYEYSSSDGSSYTITFTLEGQVQGIEGNGEVTPSGLSDVPASS